MLRIGVIIVTLLVAYVGFTSYTNSSAMNTMIEKGTEIVKTDHELEEIDIGEFKTVMVYKILPFNSKVYNIRNCFNNDYECRNNGNVYI